MTNNFYVIPKDEDGILTPAKKKKANGTYGKQFNKVNKDLNKQSASFRD